jgi:hypothetical protein
MICFGQLLCTRAFQRLPRKKYKSLLWLPTVHIFNRPYIYIYIYIFIRVYIRYRILLWMIRGRLLSISFGRIYKDFRRLPCWLLYRFTSKRNILLAVFMIMTDRKPNRVRKKPNGKNSDNKNEKKCDNLITCLQTSVRYIELSITTAPIGATQSVFVGHILYTRITII